MVIVKHIGTYLIHPILYLKELHQDAWLLDGSIYIISARVHETHIMFNTQNHLTQDTSNWNIYPIFVNMCGDFQICLLATYKRVNISWNVQDRSGLERGTFWNIMG